MGKRDAKSEALMGWKEREKCNEVEENYLRGKTSEEDFAEARGGQRKNRRKM